MTRIDLIRVDEPLAWDTAVNVYPGSCAFHSSEWKLALSASFPQYRPYDFRVESQGNVLGGWSSVLFAPMPFIELSEASPWNLFGGYVGPVETPDSDLLAGVLAAWESDARRRKHCGLTITPPPWHFETMAQVCLDAGFTMVDQKETHLLELPGDDETLWKNYKGSVRTDIRRAMRSDIAIVPARTGDLVAQFFALYAATMDRFGSLAKPLSLVARLASGPIGRLLVALRNDKLIAGLLYLHFGTTLTVWMAASDPAERRYCPNHLLYHTALTESIRAGYRLADFGASPPENKGLIHFKESFGATPAKFATMRKEIAPLRMGAWKLAEPRLRRVYRFAQRHITKP